MIPRGYVHGYSDREADRLSDQASTLTGLLHHDTRFPPGSHVLEAGCGTGSQTIIIAGQNPECRFHSVDISPASLEIARGRVQETLGNSGSDRVTFQEADITRLPYPDGTFDHIFICFVLEHLADPVAALRETRRVLVRGGSITVIEGDHGSVFFHPEGEAARDAIRCQIELQKRAGGDACIGRRLFPMLREAGFSTPHVSPRMVYVDAATPGLADGFTRRTFTTMIEGVREEAVKAGIISRERFDQGTSELLRTCGPDGVFSYTFFKANALK